MLAIALPVPAPRLSVNSNRPFWLLVSPGWACTLIWSMSSSPEYSRNTPAFRLWRPRMWVRLSERVQMGPCEKAGYGPPSTSVRPAMEMVGILSGISLLSGKM